MSSAYASLITILRHGNPMTAEQMFLQADAGLFQTIEQMQQKIRDVPVIKSIPGRPVRYHIPDVEAADSWLASRKERRYQSMPKGLDDHRAKAAERLMHSSLDRLEDFASSRANSDPELSLIAKDVRDAVTLFLEMKK